MLATLQLVSEAAEAPTATMVSTAPQSGCHRRPGAAQECKSPRGGLAWGGVALFRLCERLPEHPQDLIAFLLLRDELSEAPTVDVRGSFSFVSKMGIAT